MLKFLFFFLTSIPALQTFSQTTSDSSKSTLTLSESYNGAEIVMENPFTKPKFPGGHPAWVNFIRSKINVYTPLLKGAKPGRYQVVARYMLDKEGKIKNVIAETSCGFGMENELVNCIKTSPAWLPAAIKSGEKVSYVTRQLITFVLKEREGLIEIP